MMATAQFEASRNVRHRLSEELARSGKQGVSLVETPYEQAIRRHFQNLMAPSAGNPALSNWRSEAFQRFERLGIPTRHAEAWKAFNLRALMSKPFQATPDNEPSLRPEFLTAYSLPEATAGVQRLVFVNGRYQAALSSIQPEIAGLTIEPMVDVLKEAPDWLFQNLSTLLSEEDDAFSSLNAALFEDGACIRVREGATPDTLIELLFVTTSSADNVPHAAYPCNLIRLEPGSALNLLVQHAAPSGQTAVNHSLNAISLAEGTHLNATVLLDGDENVWHLASTRVNLAEDAAMNLSTVSLGRGTSRHAISARLLGERASVTLNGLDVLSKQGAAHHYTVMNHETPRGVSDQFYKTVLDDASQSAFNGMVFVAAGAEGTDSRQLNKNMLLSEEARAWSRPQLRINTDDVKCAHGATVGSLEPDQLFYLASRGLDRALAQSLLTFGFAEEIIERIKHPTVRRYLGERVLDSLQSSASALRQELKGNGAS